MCGALVDGVLLVVPELEAALGCLQPRQLVFQAVQILFREDAVELAIGRTLNFLQRPEDPVLIPCGNAYVSIVLPGGHVRRLLGRDPRAAGRAHRPPGGFAGGVTLRQRW